jgi:hypothetical protein
LGTFHEGADVDGSGPLPIAWTFYGLHTCAPCAMESAFSGDRLWSRGDDRASQDLRRLSLVGPPARPTRRRALLAATDAAST